MTRIVGIDLGTTNSLVAYMDNGTPRVISARHERPMVPSVVALTDNGLIVGDPAKEHLTRNPEELVLREEKVKVTLELSKKSLNFFKNAAKNSKSSYQGMIRKLLDYYVASKS
jgi:molecular chaperone DnaK (HSP70)